jgi:hypothetical protein
MPLRLLCLERLCPKHGLVNFSDYRARSTMTLELSRILNLNSSHGLQATMSQSALSRKYSAQRKSAKSIKRLISEQPMVKMTKVTRSMQLCQHLTREQWWRSATRSQCPIEDRDTTRCISVDPSITGLSDMKWVLILSRTVGSLWCIWDPEMSTILNILSMVITG